MKKGVLTWRPSAPFGVAQALAMSTKAQTATALQKDSFRCVQAGPGGKCCPAHHLTAYAGGFRALNRVCFLSSVMDDINASNRTFDQLFLGVGCVHTVSESVRRFKLLCDIRCTDPPRTTLELKCGEPLNTHCCTQDYIIISDASSHRKARELTCL
jgi:hypothetical protein